MSNRATTVLMFLLGVSMTAAIALAVVLLTGGDDSAAPTTTAATTIESTVPTTVTTVVPTTTTAPSTTVASACSGATLPPLPGTAASLSGDFDGDGEMDTFAGYQAGTTARLRITLAYGYEVEMEVPGPAQVLAAQSFPGDPRWVGIAAHDAGASTQVVGVFLLEGCDLRFAHVDDGVGLWEATFVLGGGVTHFDGLVCTADGITSRSATTNDGIAWEYTTHDYLWSPTNRTLVASGAASSTLTSPQDDDVIFTAGEFACPFEP